MQIVLPGALPDAAIAQALAAQIEEKAPHFAGWLQRAQAQSIGALPADTWCTPYEYWMLRHHGFEAEAGQPPAAGLSALYAHEKGLDHDASRPLWLGQLVHVAPAREGAALIPASELDITPDESLALFESAAELFEGTSFTATRFDDHHWRIEPPSGFHPPCASPALVSVTSVNDWWSQDVEGRPWRRLVNELQMLWFTHPVNQSREERGLRPINSVWLYGGAIPNRLRNRGEPAGKALKIVRDLHGPALIQDWGRWLQALERLDRETFAQYPIMPRLVLTGADRIVELAAGKRGVITRLFKGKQDWRQWWSPQS